MFGDLSTRAESDVQQLTALAHAMVVGSGMSGDLGPVALEPADPGRLPASNRRA